MSHRRPPGGVGSELPRNTICRLQYDMYCCIAAIQEVTVRAHRALDAPALLLGALLPLLWAPALLAQHDSTGISVSGVVGDASAGAPLEGAVVSIPELRIRTVTDEHGRFLLRGVPRGQHLWRFQMLGYAAWEEEMEAQDQEFLRVGLLPQPILLENITVTADRLEQRRKAAPYSVVVLSPDDIHSAIASSAAELITRRSPVPFRPCPPARTATAVSPLVMGNASGGTPARGGREAPRSRPLGNPLAHVLVGNCVYSRGRVIPPTIYLDEEFTPTSLDMLATYAPDEIYTVEYYSFGTHIRVYTTQFIESGRPLLPSAAVFRRF